VLKHKTAHPQNNGRQHGATLKKCADPDVLYYYRPKIFAPMMEYSVLCNVCATSFMKLFSALAADLLPYVFWVRASGCYSYVFRSAGRS